MAIPTLPGFKARRGVSNEVSAFAKAFASTFASLNRGNRSGSARDTGPYSDKAVEDQDPRLSKGIFGGLFGSNTDNLTPYEQGMLRQQALYDLAVKRGDPEAIDRARTNMAKLNQLYDKGLIAKPGESFKATGYDNTGGTPPQDQTQPQQQGSALPIPDQSYTPSNYNYGGDYVSPIQEFVRGGPVGVPSAIPQGTIAPPAGEDEEFVDYTNSTPNYINGRPDYNQGEEPTGPAEFSPEDLENPEALNIAAAQAVDAGYRTLSKRLEGNAALPNEDSDYQSNVRAYAMGEGRMTDDEVKAIDKAIDPDGTMPRAQRSAARMAAIYKYYKDQGDEETANDVAARLVQYNEFAGQTRAQLASQAIQQGKIQEGVKLLADAYEDNVPDGKSVKTTVNPDNSVTVAIGYERRGEDGRISLAPELERTIPLSELPQVAGYLTEQGKRLIMDVGAKANAKASAGAAGGGPDLQKALSEVRSAGDELRAAQKSGDTDAIAKAEARAAAALKAANDIPLPKTRTGNQDTAADTRRRLITSAFGAVGGTSRAGATTGARTTGGSEKERAAAARDQAVRETIVSEVRAREDAPTTAAGRAFEPSDDADARNAAIQRAQLRRADVTYSGAEKRKTFSKDYGDRTEPLVESLKVLEEEAKEDAASKKVDPATLPKISATGRRRFIEVADQLAASNDVSPDRIVRSLYNATYRMSPDAQPRIVTDGSGNAFMQIGSEQFVVNRDTFRRIAEMRGEVLSKARVSNREAVERKNNEPPPPPPALPQSNIQGPIDVRQSGVQQSQRLYQTLQPQNRRPDSRTPLYGIPTE